jgi:hypothetical protein
LCAKTAKFLDAHQVDRALMPSAHDLKKIWTCLECNQSFFFFDDLVEHMNSQEHHVTTSKSVDDLSQRNEEKQTSTNVGSQE